MACNKEQLRRYLEKPLEKDKVLLNIRQASESAELSKKRNFQIPLSDNLKGRRAEKELIQLTDDLRGSFLYGVMELE
jgi:hypothetical protein